jgi:uncharacterized ferritin-like protein (DUF455 family)
MIPQNEEFLKRILFGGKLSDKLSSAESFCANASPEKISAPSFDLIEKLQNLNSPAREGKLASRKTPGKDNSGFPKKNELGISSNRGRLLHYFANHELLAIETMAFVLLRFPDADPKFRAGVLRTLQDEQRHLNQYINRMNDFGVELGDFSLNLYFWNTLKQMRTPLDFVTQMSLTFEQANLDFACFYANLFQTEIDDAKTGLLLKEVHDDEIKHVAHGMKWFNEWKNPEQSEYDAYRELLPYPMTPRRARGNFMFAGVSRKTAGMSDEFIECVRIAGGSRGKVPNYFFFNPQAEIEHATPELSKVLKQKVDELAAVILWLADEEDVVELSVAPPLSFLTRAFNFKGALPEIVNEVPEVGKYAAFENLKPWAWSRSAWKKLESLEAPVRCPPPFSESLHANFLLSKRYWKDKVPHHDEELIASGKFAELLIKVARGTSGRGHLRIAREQLASPEIKSKIERIKKSGNEVVIEPYYPKVCDFSVQYELRSDGVLIEFEPRFFKVDHLFQYRGAIIGRANHLKAYEASAKLVDQNREQIRSAHQPVIDLLKSHHYVGPFGIDCLTYEATDGSLQIQPFIEINPRFTMGRVAHEIERIAQGKKHKQGIYRILNSRELENFQFSSFAALEEKLISEYGENFIAITPSSALETWVFVVLDKNAAERFL